MHRNQNSNPKCKHSSNIAESISHSPSDSNNKQNKNLALTLPRHSPHSPLFNNSKNQPQSKLSARYINNKIAHSMEVKSVNQFQNIIFKQNDANTEIVSNICKCKNGEKRQHKEGNECINTERKCIDSATNTTADLCSTKRVVTTRNAATSPNLNTRKLENTNVTTVNNKKHEVHHSNINESTNKLKLEKSNSLGESKPQSQLRNTRSLSPKPPKEIKENASKKTKSTTTNKVENENNLDDLKMITRNKVLPLSKRPNADTSKRFANKSAENLFNLHPDPWLKIENWPIDETPAHSKKLETYKMREKKHSFDMSTDLNNPWVKRNDNNFQQLSTPPPRKERFREAKSFSATKFEIDVSSETKRNRFRNKFQHNKTSLYTDALPLQSAPSSPNYLKAPENQNPFISTLALSLSPSPNVPQQTLSSTHSVSFSPARTKDFPNIFTAQENYANRENNFKFTPNRSFLDVSASNLQARHSFSSVSQQLNENELQLNIRRLSEQIKKSSNSSLNNDTNKFFNDQQTRDQPPQPNQSNSKNNASAGADFSDYLEQFRYSEARKREKLNSSDASLSAQQKSKVQIDALLETTC